MITADQVRATKWQTLSHVDFARGGWGYLWESIDVPGLQKKIWRPSRREHTRGALLVRGRPLGVYQLPDDGSRFPDEVYQWAADLLNQAPAERAA